MRITMVVVCFLAIMFSVACDEFYCPKKESCTRTCSENLNTTLDDCNQWYGPARSNDVVLYDACQGSAYDRYDMCYDDCPCKNEVDPNVDVKACK
jgi:hypothetical protein